jgi:hypothetical protein
LAAVEVKPSPDDVLAEMVYTVSADDRVSPERLAEMADEALARVASV